MLNHGGFIQRSGTVIRRRLFKIKLLSTFYIVLSVTIAIFLTNPASSASPSNDAEWNQMYSACVAGNTEGFKILKLQLPNTAGPELCSCMLDKLKSTSESERDNAFNSIKNTCMDSVLTHNKSPYPQEATRNIINECKQRNDISKISIDKYCSCYAEYLPAQVSWRQYLLLDSAIRVKGSANIDQEEKNILKRILETGFYCQQKTP